MHLYKITGPNQLDDLKLVETETPRPGRGQALVRVRATSLNFRDLMIVKGQYGRAPARVGLIPLSDGAGEVVEIGESVSRVKVGDRVAGSFHQYWLGGETSDAVVKGALGGDLDGMLAQYVVLDENGLVQLPKHLSFEEGATLPCAAVTAWHAMFDYTPVKPGDTVLTQGTGGVSVFAIQFASLAGARVIATSSSDEKLAKVKKLGATDVINYKTTPEWDQAALELTGGHGVDHVVEVGGSGTIPRSLRATRRGGTVSVIGLLSGFGEIDPMVILARSLNVRGIYVGSRNTFETMNKAIERHEVRPVIDKVFAFEKAADAYRHLESGAHFGKVVVSIG